jgi:hypothetical protein
MLLFSSADLLARFGMVRQGKARHGVAGRGKARFFFLPQGNEQETHMKTINVTIEGVAPISFSAPVQSVKNQGEAHDAFEDRTWREKMHVENGEVFIPPGALKGCLTGRREVHLSENRFPARARAKYTKHFEARNHGLSQPLMLGD